ncbi:hypothetical protein EV214_102256 [Marinisporobacter balticus]|uniref:Uncharacterized protein n=2 Tax=Marinisporobacter balticus TaxID=2018667 RepID=A0A4R2KY21_9FIRM|nr:hypothetical protein EV214_102256 [Marinisporobacter balticus]
MMVVEMKNILSNIKNNEKTASIVSLINILNDEFLYSDKVSNVSVAIKKDLQIMINKGFF